MKTLITVVLAMFMTMSGLQGVPWDQDMTVMEQIDDIRPFWTPRNEDWPMFMHDINRTGNTTSSIPNTNQSLWNFSTGSEIRSSPAIVNGVAFFGSFDNNFYAVWTSNGTQKWSFNDNGNLADIPSSPTVVNDKVYFYAMDVGMYCVWASNGTKVWNNTIAPANFRNFNSPLVANGTVFIADDGIPGTIFALDADTGAEAWNHPRSSGYVISTASYRNGIVYIGLQQGGGILALYDNNGTEYWRQAHQGGAVYSTPSIGEDRLFFTNEGGWLYAIDLDDGSQIWRNDTGPNTYSSPALSGDKVVIAGSAYYQSNGTRAWNNGYSLYSTPAVSGNRMVYLNETDLRCQSVDDGTVIWEVYVDGEYASPAIVENMVLVGGSDGVMRAFSTPDITPPNVSSTYPVDTAADVDPNINISVIFSELMDEALTEAAFSIAPSVTGQFTWIGNNMTFDPDTPLASETIHTVTVAGTATDRSNNGLDGDHDGGSEGSPTDDYSFSFATEILPPPTITGVSPADQEVVRPNVAVQINFSQPMNRWPTRNAFGISGSVLGVFSWDVASMQLTFTPNSDLREDFQYNVTMANTAQDATGKFLDGNEDGTASNDATDDHKWSFYVRDWTPPQMVDMSPRDGTDLVPVNAEVVMEFSEVMDQAATEGAILISPSIPGAYIWSGANLTLSPSSDLLINTSYTVSVSTAAADLAGNQLDGDGDGTGGEGVEDEVYFTFTTGDTRIDTPPVIEWVRPMDGRNNVAVGETITAVFSQPMRGTTTEAAFSIVPPVVGLLDGDGYDLVLVPDADLAYATTYTVTITRAATNMRGIPFDGNGDGVGGQPDDDRSWSFTTAPDDLVRDPPKVLDVSPDHGAVDVDAGAPIIMTFSKTMDEAAVESAFSMDPATNGNFSWSGVDMTFASDGLEYNTTYHVTVGFEASDADGIGFDGNGNGMAEDNSGDDYLWVFTTGKEPVVMDPLPKVISTTPADVATDVELDIDIIIEFSEEMDRAATETALLLGSLSAIEYSVGWDSASKIMTINPTNDLNENTTYVVKVTGEAMSALGMRLDGNLNDIAEGLGIDDHVWNFTTKVIVVPGIRPEVMITEPAHNDIVKRMIEIKGWAADDDTLIDLVTIEIMFDQDGNWTQVGTGIEWTYNWNTKKVDNGRHEIAVRAFDGGLYSDTHSISVHVNNKKDVGSDGLDSSLLIALIVIIIIVIVVIVLVMMRRGKGTGQAAPPPQQPMTPPVQQQPVTTEAPPPPAPQQPPPETRPEAPTTPPPSPAPEPQPQPVSEQPPPSGPGGH